MLFFLLLDIVYWPTFIFMAHWKNSVGCWVKLGDHSLLPALQHSKCHCTQLKVTRCYFLLWRTQCKAPSPIVLSGFVFIWHYAALESGFAFINIRKQWWRSNACQVVCNPWTKQTLLSPSSLFTRHGRMKSWKDQRAEHQQYQLIIDSVSNTTDQGQNTGHHKGQTFRFSGLANTI